MIPRIRIRAWRAITAILGFALVCTANASHASTTRLAFSEPAWSHDGKAIALVGRKPSGEFGLYVMSAAGGRIRQLDTGGSFARWPTWSPNDRQIAFATSDGISVIGADGRGLRQIVKNGWTPAWSPGGRKIAYAFGEETSGSTIYVVNPDGSQRQVAAKPSVYKSFVSPTWSPDGDRLAFYVTDAPDAVPRPRSLGIVSDYGGRTKVLLRGHEPVQPAWSPKGGEIAFSENARWISVFDLVSKKVRRLRPGRNPSWSPDGTKIAFGRSGAIFVMHSDGSGERRLTP